ncbi:MAG: hypothetical protein Sapg2KO_42430 [Saprospiraceae bacterium]
MGVELTRLMENDAFQAKLLHNLGLDYGGSGDFNVILMDVQMPKMNVYEATPTIRNLIIKKQTFQLSP